MVSTPAVLVNPVLTRVNRTPGSLFARDRGNISKQARYTCNISRSLSHTKQTRYTCNISRSLSHEAKQAHYT